MDEGENLINDHFVMETESLFVLMEVKSTPFCVGIILTHPT